MNYTIIVSEYLKTEGYMHSEFTPAYAYPLIMCFSENEVEMFLKEWAALSFTEKDFVILINGFVVDILPVDDYKRYLTLLDRLEREFLPVVAEEFSNRR